ncbi:SDR family NAD(P)-dependent oxidoreductase [Paenibacillus sp. TC-CSREp1]|uniref:SDR family NAD(P)-dependent oxidoreductase n=1 Tax=Paenibacillus sp. TC-CSREp1 TaxID=3410089 RepID=UPI003CEC8DA3
MKRAIVIGATGGTGEAITRELVKQGIHTVALGRSRSKLEQLGRKLGSPACLEMVLGDAMHPDDLIEAARDVDVMFHCANVPYQDMETRLIPLGESVMKAAEDLGKKLVVIDGIYPYGRRQMDEVTEEHPKQPHTRKGKTRLAYEQMLFSDRWSRAQVMIVRLPDYYGPSANEASYLGSTLEAIAKGKMAFFIGNMKVAREYVYLPDAADMVVKLAGRDSAYGQNWNIPGTGLISGQNIVRIAQKAAGRRKPVIALGKVGLSLLGLGVPVMKEIVEMLYLTEEPLILSRRKYEEQIGPITATSFEEGITKTIQAIQEI